MIETNDMNFWTKMKEVLSEVFSSEKTEEPIEEVKLEAEPTVEPQEPTEPQEPKNEPTEPIAEPQPTPEPQEPKNEPTEPQEPQPIEEPKDNHLEELINSLKEEISALKEMNNGLNDKVKELSRQPSTQPINTNAKPSAGDTYSAWREQLRSYM
jgi:outer membrane biosynthesis protein TonB